MNFFFKVFLNIKTLCEEIQLNSECYIVEIRH